jgi:hypothetical protein
MMAGNTDNERKFITTRPPLQTQTLKVFSAKQYPEFAGNPCWESIFDRKEDL